MTYPVSSLAYTLRAPAKINLCLKVVERLGNGYHHLDMLVGFASQVGDELQLQSASGGEIAFELEGPFSADLRHEDTRLNLVTRAAQLMQKAVAEHVDAAPKGAVLRLTKNLPVASGIGGGSADAAAVIEGLQLLWGVQLPENKKLALALQLGADVPMCLYGRACHVTGIGEAIATLGHALPGWFVLLNPGVRVSTREVFESLDLRKCGGSLSLQTSDFASPENLATALMRGGNDLQQAALLIAPQIGSCLEALHASEGCLAAQMTGSGATCFGLYASEQAAIAARQTIAKRQPEWWLAVTQLV